MQARRFEIFVSLSAYSHVIQQGQGSDKHIGALGSHARHAYISSSKRAKHERKDADTHSSVYDVANAGHPFPSIGTRPTVSNDAGVHGPVCLLGFHARI